MLIMSQLQSQYNFKSINYIIYYLRIRYNIKKRIFSMNPLNNNYLIAASAVKKYIKHYQIINMYQKNILINKVVLSHLLEFVKYNYTQQLYKFLRSELLCMYKIYKQHKL
jgi:hypothetical protein